LAFPKPKRGKLQSELANVSVARHAILLEAAPENVVERLGRVGPQGAKQHRRMR
jgi:hypothetical protein